jgi:hypothetical protein
MQGDQFDTWPLMNACFSDMYRSQAGEFPGDFFFRHASEQYKTCAQFLAQDLRQVISRAHTVQSLLGKCCLLPLKDDFMAQMWAG